MEPVCPTRSNAVCQCSPNNVCPSGASCTMGTCCSSGISPIVSFSVPGTSCQNSNQCNGFQSTCAQCVQEVCSCVNGAASNGATCEQMAPTVLTLARNGCDQYGSPCKFLLSTARRRPLFAPIGNMTETPRKNSYTSIFSKVQKLQCSSTWHPKENVSPTFKILMPTQHVFQTKNVLTENAGCNAL